MKRIDYPQGLVYALTDGVRGYSLHHVDEQEMDEPWEAWFEPDGDLEDALFEDLEEANRAAFAERSGHVVDAG